MQRPRVSSLLCMSIVHRNLLNPCDIRCLHMPYAGEWREGYGRCTAGSRVSTPRSSSAQCGRSRERSKARVWTVHREADSHSSCKEEASQEGAGASEIVPKSIADADTDVIEVGDVRALARTERMRPVRPGSSIGHYKVTAGTFGAVVYDIKTGEPLILSNNHVLANSTCGKDGRAKIGDPILQPGRHDSGREPHDVIGHLYRFVPISMAVGTSDCRVAAVVERLLNAVVRRFRKNYSLRVFRAPL